MSERGGGIGNPPGAPQQIPGVPSNFLPIVFEGFETLDTKTERPGIRAQDMAICDGFFPIGPNNLRVLPGVGANVYALGGGDLRTLLWFDFGNIADTQYLVVLLSDGSLLAVNLTTPGTQTILAAGGIAFPRNLLGFSQWGSKYLMFGEDQPNGYWLWDGTSTFTAGTLDPEMTLVNAGSDYTTAPTVTMQTTGAGTGAVFSPQVDTSSGSLTRILVPNPGTGFVEGDLVSFVITGGGGDSQATATASLSAGGGVTAIVVVNPGSGYTYKTVITVTGGGGSGAAFVPNIVNGAISSVTVINPGTGYTSPPTVVWTDPGFTGSPGGTGASLYSEVGSNGIASVTVVNGGSGYVSLPQIVFLGDGQNATAHATIIGGAVTGITIDNPGMGYTKALVDLRGGNDAANVTGDIFPFGLSGVALETYVNRVWFSNGAARAVFPPQNRTIFTAAGSPTDVDPSDGAGAFPSNDSFLKIGYFSIKQSNGFLYLIGDSSLNALSGVNTSSTGTPPVATTTFNNQNADPQIGSPWPSSVQQFKRNIVLANTLGVFISYGGAVEKVSDALDGFYTSPGVNIGGAGLNFSSAVSQIFGRYVYMLLLPVIDPVTGVQTNKLLMTDGRRGGAYEGGTRWWTSSQDKALTYIASQEFNSTLTAFGTDGKSIFPLFKTPSTGFTKTVSSKLWATPGYYVNKTGLHVLGVVKYYSNDSLTIFADNETGVSASATVPAPGSAPATKVFGPIPIGQNGRLIGLTLQTTASDVAILSLMLVSQNYTATV